MNKNAMDIMMGAPAEVEQKQLDDVHIMIHLPQAKRAIVKGREDIRKYTGIFLFI